MLERTMTSKKAMEEKATRIFEDILDFHEEVVRGELKLKNIPLPKFLFAEEGMQGIRGLNYETMQFCRNYYSSNLKSSEGPGTRRIVFNPEYTARVSDYYSLNKMLQVIFILGHEYGHYLKDMLYPKNSAHPFIDDETTMQYYDKFLNLDAENEDTADYLSGIFASWYLKKYKLNRDIKVYRNVFMRILNVYGEEGEERSSEGHGTKDHRMRVFAEGLAAKNPAEEIQLLFGIRNRQGRI